MSYREEVHVGVYLEVDSRKVEVPVKYHGCPIHGEHSSRFCPNCGIVASVMEKTRPDWIDLHFLLDGHFEEWLFQPSIAEGDSNHLILFGNHSSVNADFDNDVVEITPETITQQIEIFATYYADVIQHIQRLGDKATVKFGVVRHVT